MRESGISGYEEAGSDLWFGVLAPAGTPKAVVDRLNMELVKALRTPEVSERIRVQAYDVWTLSPEEFMNFLRTDHARWGKVVKFAGAKADSPDGSILTCRRLQARAQGRKWQQWRVFRTHPGA